MAETIPETPKYKHKGTSFKGVTSATKQQFRHESNINNIMAKYEKEGLIDHLSKHKGQYGDFSNSIQYQDALNSIMLAQTMFDELPSGIRKKFSNDPQQFLEFVHNPDNHDEMVEMGLANSTETASKAAADTQESIPQPTIKKDDKTQDTAKE